MIAGMVYEKDSIAAQASSIGQLESVGLSWKLIDQDLEALKAVTPDDIQKAARTYFTPSRLTLAQVLPVKAEEKEARHGERTGLRYGLLGLIVIALLAALAYFVARPPDPGGGPCRGGRGKPVAVAEGRRQAGAGPSQAGHPGMEDRRRCQGTVRRSP